MVKVKSSDFPVVVLQRRVTASNSERLRSLQGDLTELKPPLFSSDTVPSHERLDLLYFTLQLERPPITSSLRPRQVERSFLPKSSRGDMLESELKQAGTRKATASAERNIKRSILHEPTPAGAGSFADAEVAEDVVEQVVWGNRSGDAPEVFKRFLVVDRE